MYSIKVSLKITEEELLRYYRGSAKVVYARDVHGRSVQFPVNILQPFVSREGIEGVFEIYFDSNGKFESVKKL